MPVLVEYLNTTTDSDASTGSAAEKRVDAAYAFTVRDGVLVLLDDSTSEVALFAAGTWRSAQVDDA